MPLWCHSLHRHSPTTAWTPPSPQHAKRDLAGVSLPPARPVPRHRELRSGRVRFAHLAPFLRHDFESDGQERHRLCTRDEGRLPGERAEMLGAGKTGAILGGKQRTAVASSSSRQQQQAASADTNGFVSTDYPLVWLSPTSGTPPCEFREPVHVAAVAPPPLLRFSTARRRQNVALTDPSCKIICQLGEGQRTQIVFVAASGDTSAGGAAGCRRQKRGGGISSARRQTEAGGKGLVLGGAGLPSSELVVS